MSRIGKKPIPVPDKVKVSMQEAVFTAEGPLGKEVVEVNPLAKVTIEDKLVTITRVNETKQARSMHGLVRALLANAVTGVSEGFKRHLEINGIGYRAALKGKTLSLNLGFSHDAIVDIPEGLKIEVADQNKVTVSGVNKERVGRLASQIRSIRPPEPYKGKGIKYAEENIIRKVGKTAGGK